METTNFIKGITLLHAIDHGSDAGFKIVINISLVIMVAGIICMFIALVQKHPSFNIFVCGIMLMLIGGIVCTVCSATRSSTTFGYTYEVLIDDSVSMNEFYNTYEILDHRDMIYEVKVKE